MNSPNSRTNEGGSRRPANLLRPASDVSWVDDGASEDSGSLPPFEVRPASAVVHCDPTQPDGHAAVAESESLDDDDGDTLSLVRSSKQPVVIVTPPGDVEDKGASARPPTPPRFQRRNSVSLPAGLNEMEPPEYELRLTPERTQADGYDTSDTFSDVMTDDDDDSKATAVAGSRRVTMPAKASPGRPLSNQQMEEADGGRSLRSSLRVPSPSPTPTKNGKGLMNHEQDGDDLLLELGLHTDPSPGNSITSMNSISSLLKEKLADKDEGNLVNDLTNDKVGDSSIPPPKRKKENALGKNRFGLSEEVFKKACKALDDPDDEYTIFGQFVASEMRSFRSDDSKRRFKLGVQKLLVEITEQEYFPQQWQRESFNQATHNRHQSPHQTSMRNNFSDTDGTMHGMNNSGIQSTFNAHYTSTLAPTESTGNLPDFRELPFAMRVAQQPTITVAMTTSAGNNAFTHL